MKKCIGQRTSKITFFTSVENRLNRHKNNKTVIVDEHGVARDLVFYSREYLEYLGDGKFLNGRNGNFVILSGSIGSDYGTNTIHTIKKGVELNLKPKIETKINTLGRAYRPLTLKDIDTNPIGLVDIWGKMTSIEWIGTEQKTTNYGDQRDWFIVSLGENKYLIDGYAGFEFTPI